MARIQKELQVLSINLTLTLGEGRNYWSSPNVTRYENFEIPIRMFTVKALAELIGDMIAEMPKELEEEIEHSKQEAIEELAKKAQEAGVVID